MSFWCVGLLIIAMVISEHLAFLCYVANLLDAGKYEIGYLEGSQIIFSANINLKKTQSNNSNPKEKREWAEQDHMSYPDLFTS